MVRVARTLVDILKESLALVDIVQEFILVDTFKVAPTLVDIDRKLRSPSHFFK